MNKKIFSKIDKIPRGRATDKISKVCLVLEGGAFRGLYGEGVLDALMLAGINAECRSHERHELCVWPDWTCSQSQPYLQA